MLYAMRGKSFAFLLALPLALASCTPSAAAEFNSNANALAGGLRAVNEIATMVGGPRSTTTTARSGSSTTAAPLFVRGEEVKLVGNRQGDVRSVQVTDRYNDKANKGRVEVRLTGQNAAENAKFARMNVQRIEDIGSVQVTLASKRIKESAVVMFVQRADGSGYMYNVGHFVIPGNIAKGTHTFPVEVNANNVDEVAEIFNDPDRAPLLFMQNLVPYEKSQGTYEGEFGFNCRSYSHIKNCIDAYGKDAGLQPGDRVVAPTFTLRGTLR